MDVDSRILETSKIVCRDVLSGFLGAEAAVEDPGEHVSFHLNDTAIDWERRNSIGEQGTKTVFV